MPKVAKRPPSARKRRMYEQIERHGRKVQAIFPKTRTLDPVALAKSLKRLEGKAHHAAERLSSEYGHQDTYDAIHDSVLASLDKLLGFKKAGVPVFVNSDPRGYALKIDDNYVRDHGLDIHTDFGGYGILAPEYDGRR